MTDIVINYNDDYLKGTLEALDASCLKGLVHTGMKVSIKPNMVLAKLPSQGATTHSEVVEGIICFTQNQSKIPDPSSEMLTAVNISDLNNGIFD